jgi:hypothetical protein
LIIKDLKQLYLEKLKKTDFLTVIIVGQDPYKEGSNGIAFCKNSFTELEQFNCCGKELLFSLGIDLKQAKKDFLTPIELFMDLLKNGIAFINVNHGLFSENSNPIEFKDYNNQFLLKAKTIIVLGLTTTKSVFDKNYPSYSNVYYLIHPSGYNRENSFDKWSTIWATTYLKTNFINNK